MECNVSSLFLFYKLAEPPFDTIALERQYVIKWKQVNVYTIIPLTIWILHVSHTLFLFVQISNSESKNNFEWKVTRQEQNLSLFYHHPVNIFGYFKSNFLT